ncbi:MAG: hypothetical protein GX621_07585 [Pirellulaceae bacterium]|nr:hypothetical protein [Pirellulaceae bacterium]
MDSTYVIPPAPMPHQTKWVPTGPSLAPAPLPTILPPGKVLPTTLVGQPGTATPVENLGFEPNEAPMPPISVVNVGGEPMPLPDLNSNQCVELTARPDPLGGSVPLAPLPGTPAPTTSEPSPTKDPPQPAKPWVEPGEWKSRRPASEPSKALTVEFQKPVDVHPVGLDGYCPVELARHEQWVDGNPQLAVEHEGRTYLLSGPQQQRLFRANPERYAPVLAGRDPVLAATSGDLVPGRTEMCVIYDGRLFMFSSKATLAAFNEDPERFAGELAKPAK